MVGREERHKGRTSWQRKKREIGREEKGSRKVKKKWCFNFLFVFNTIKLLPMKSVYFLPLATNVVAI